jgi:hypothetical protein
MPNIMIGLGCLTEVFSRMHPTDVHLADGDGRDVEQIGFS